MKVKELIDGLRNFDGELEVLCYTEDASLLCDGHMFRLLNVEGVSSVNGEKRRAKDGVPSMKLGKSGNSSQHVFIDVTSEF